MGRLSSLRYGVRDRGSCSRARHGDAICALTAARRGRRRPRATTSRTVRSGGLRSATTGATTTATARPMGVIPVRLSERRVREARAAHHARSALRRPQPLRRRFGNAFRYSVRKISCRRRLGRGRHTRRVARPRRLVNRKPQIWYSTDGAGRAVWDYNYRIKRTNEYCVVTGKRGCTRAFRVR